jgi:hypothetical protein
MFARLEEFRFARWVKSLNRSTQILLSLTLVGVLNYAAARHYQRADLTPDQRFSLGPETLAYLNQKVPKTADTPLQIISILPEDDSEYTRLGNEQINRLLEEYKEAGKNAQIPLEINNNKGPVDPVRESARYEELLRLGIPPYTRILVMRGTHFHALNDADLYDTQSTDDGNKATGFNGENAITSAILDVIQTAPDEIYFTQGHGELSFSATDKAWGLSAFTEFLHKRNFELKPLDLAGDNEIPDTAKLVVIAAASRKFLDSEIEKLRQYLSQHNGRLLIFLKLGADNGLDGLLHDWGLHSTDRMIVEDPSHTTNDYGMIIDPSDHPNPHALVRFMALSDHHLNLLFGPSRPVEVDPTSSDEQRNQVSPLLFSSKKSILVKDWAEADGPHFSALDSQASVSVAALSEQHAYGTTDLPGGRMLVIGDVFLITNQYFSEVGNPDFILNCVNDLTDRENLLDIHPRLPQQSKLDITRAQYVGLAWRLGLLPAAVAVFGLFVFWVRNRT